MPFVYNSYAMSKVTIRDIALRAGVSKTTVSFALNYPERISKETYKRIMAIVEELGYVPNPFARTLTTKRLGAIGLLLPQKIGDIFANSHMAQVISGIGEECEQKEFSLAILPLVRGKIVEAARKSYVDGLVTIGVGPDHEVVSLLKKNHIPFVTIDGEESTSTINIGIDDSGAAKDLMLHVLEQGFRRIAILSLEPDTKPRESGHFSLVVQRRLDGFQRALGEYGLTLNDSQVCVQPCKGSIDAGYESARSLLLRETRPTAIVAMSDIVAIGVLLAAKELGLRVPQDVAVAGFDDIPESIISTPRLTTIHQPAREKGMEAARMVMRMLDGAGGSHIRLPYQLIVRESTRLP